MSHSLLFLGLGAQEILLIALVALLFFGGRKIPELMRGLGQGLRSFREGLDGDKGKADRGPDASDKSQGGPQAP